MVERPVKWLLSFILHLLFHRANYKKRFLEITATQEHVIMSTTREIMNVLEHLYLKRNAKFPFKLFKDNYASMFITILAKRNFPYLPKVNDAILHFWENGFLRDGLWITEFKG